MFKLICMLLLAITTNSINAMSMFSKGKVSTTIGHKIIGPSMVKGTLEFCFNRAYSTNSSKSHELLNILKELSNKKNNIKYISNLSQTSTRIEDKIKEQENKIEQLIKKVENINTTDPQGRTLLMYAISTGNYKIVEELIKAKADVNARDNYGRTPLMYAVESNNIKLVELLIKANANPDIQDNEGRTSLIYAAKKNYSKFLLNNSRIKYNSKDTVKFIVSIISQLRINKHIATLLIDANADLNIKDEHGYTALHYTAVSNNYKIAKLLIHAGVYINIQSNWGDRPIEIAQKLNHEKVVQLIKLKFGI